MICLSSVSKASWRRTSTSIGAEAVPRRAWSSVVDTETGDMVRPCVAPDAILQHVASWGDRIPHALNKGNALCTVKWSKQARSYRRTFVVAAQYVRLRELV